MSFYVFDLEPDDNGTFLATCPAFPEINTYVDDAGGVLFEGLGAVEEAIAARISDGRDIPAFSSAAEMKAVQRDEDGVLRKSWVKLPTQTLLKVMLYNLLRDENVTRAELGRRLNWNRESVDRLFRLEHRSRLEQFDAAFRGLHRDLTIGVTDGFSLTGR